MKNKKMIICVFVVILIVVAILLILNFSDSSNMQQSEKSNPQNDQETPIAIQQNLYPVADYDLDDNSKNKLIKNSEELNSYLTSTYSENFDEVLSKYGEEFFVEGALALAYVKLEKNNQIPFITSLNIDENNLEIGYSTKENEEGTSNAYVILVETDKTLSTVTSTQL